MAKSSLPPGFKELANQRWQEAKRFWGHWRGTARDDYAFIAGKQWLEDDMRILESQKRPPITFNYSEKMIDAVVGAEVSNRQEVTYAPREINDGPLAELWTNAAKWVRDESNIEDEETDAFRDTLVCGMGWTHTKVSFETDLDGMIEVHRVDPLEMYPDPAATKPGLTDRRYSFRLQWVDEREAKLMWPNNLMLGSETNAQEAPGVDVVRQGDGYNDDPIDSIDQHKGQVQILHYECVELRPVYRVATQDGGTSDVEADVFSQMRTELDSSGVKYVKMQKRTYYYAYFAGETFLEGDLSPTQEGFTYNAITCKRDRNMNTWYGLTRVMKDPQRWANKWLSQILHIINSNAKGGLLAETGAFVDPKKAQDEWSMPESITLLKEGGIGKVQQKQMTSYPSGLDRLMEFALASLPQVTGINLEALGLAAREQANVLEQSRKQAAYGLLAPVFDSLRRYKKHQGRVLLDFINNYISDGRMIRIGGPESQQFIQLTKAPRAAHYDIIVDQSPQAPDVKRDTWQALQQLLPAALKAGMPIPPTILKYAPVPTSFALEWQQHMQQGQNSPEQMKKMQEQMQQLQQQNQQLQQQVKDKSQELQLKQQDAQVTHQLKLKELEMGFQLKTRELEMELQLKQAQFRQESQIKQIETRMQLEQDEQQHQQNMALKQQQVTAQIEQQAQSNSQE